MMQPSLHCSRLTIMLRNSLPYISRLFQILLLLWVLKHSFPRALTSYAAEAFEMASLSMTIMCKMNPWFYFAGLQVSLEVSADCKQTVLRPLNAEVDRTKPEKLGVFERQAVEYAGFEDLEACKKSPIPEFNCSLKDGRQKCFMRPISAVGYAVHQPYMGVGWEWPLWLQQNEASFHHLRCNSWWRQLQSDVQEPWIEGNGWHVYCV